MPVNDGTKHRGGKVLARPVKFFLEKEGIKSIP